MSAFFEAIGRFDLAAFQWLRVHHYPFFDVLMAGLSDIARGGTIWIVLAFLIAFFKPERWRGVVHVLLAVMLAYLITDYAAKPFFNRSRPFESYTDARVYGHKPTTRSFPSGHAASALAGVSALVRLAPEARSIFWFVALLVAFSRVYLGVHYPGDVIAGALFGLAIGEFVVGGTKWRFGNSLSHRKDATTQGSL